MIAVAEHRLNPDCIAYANLAFTWNTELPEYEMVGHFNSRIGEDIIKHTGIFVILSNGKSLTFDDRDAATAEIRAALSDEGAPAERHPHAAILPGYSYDELQIIAGLPAELQTTITGGITCQS